MMLKYCSVEAEYIVDPTQLMADYLDNGCGNEDVDELEIPETLRCQCSVALMCHCAIVFRMLRGRSGVERMVSRRLPRPPSRIPSTQRPSFELPRGDGDGLGRRRSSSPSTRTANYQDYLRDSSRVDQQSFEVRELSV